MKTAENAFWAEKYRPKVLEDIILSERLFNQFDAIRKSGRMPNMLLSGGAGRGKTTVARALASELDYDLLFVNASEDSGIDVLRSRIRSFCSTKSFEEGKRKVVILDEADHLNPVSTQPALRSFMEEFAEHVSFILTANYPNKILPALQSRCQLVDFQPVGDESKQLLNKVSHRMIEILKKEGVTIDVQAVISLTQRFSPDIRKIINEMQGIVLQSSDGKTLEKDHVLLNGQAQETEEIWRVVEAKNWTEAQKWVVRSTIDPARFFADFYTEAPKYIDKSNLPDLVVLIAEYQDKATRSLNPDITIIAFLTEVIGLI